jgi:hypothetical protein
VNFENDLRENVIIGKHPKSASEVNRAFAQSGSHFTTVRGKQTKQRNNRVDLHDQNTVRFVNMHFRQELLISCEGPLPHWFDELAPYDSVQSLPGSFYDPKWMPTSFEPVNWMMTVMCLFEERFCLTIANLIDVSLRAKATRKSEKFRS